MNSSCRFGVAAVLLGCLTLAVGCSSGPKLVTVSGKVTAGKVPLTSGAITFVPDESKGNKAKVSPTGQINSDGTYSLMTNGKPGAPVGHYKVTVFTDFPGSTAPSKVKLDPIYSDPTKTLLNVEIVESPKSYDVNVP